MAADYSWVNPTLRNVAGPGMLAQYGNRDLLTTMLGWADDQRIVRHRNITSTLRSGWQHRHRASEPLAVNRMNVGNLRAHYPDLLGDAMKAQATSTPFVNGEDGASADDDFKTDFLEFYRLYYGLSVQDGLALDAIIRNDDNIGRIFQWLVHYINRFLFWHQSVYLGAMKRTSGRNRTQLRHIQFRWIGRAERGWTTWMTNFQTLFQQVRNTSKLTARAYQDICYMTKHVNTLVQNNRMNGQRSGSEKFHILYISNLDSYPHDFPDLKHYYGDAERNLRTAPPPLEEESRPPGDPSPDDPQDGQLGGRGGPGGAADPARNQTWQGPRSEYFSLLNANNEVYDSDPAETALPKDYDALWKADNDDPLPLAPIGSDNPDSEDDGNGGAPRPPRGGGPPRGWGPPRGGGPPGGGGPSGGGGRRDLGGNWRDPGGSWHDRGGGPPGGGARDLDGKRRSPSSGGPRGTGPWLTFARGSKTQGPIGLRHMRMTTQQRSYFSRMMEDETRRLDQAGDIDDVDTDGKVDDDDDDSAESHDPMVLEGPDTRRSRVEERRTFMGFQLGELGREINSIGLTSGPSQDGADFKLNLGSLRNYGTEEKPRSGRTQPTMDYAMDGEYAYREAADVLVDDWVIDPASGQFESPAFYAN